MLDIFAYKIAPLCPTLARKLRLVCKTLAEEIPTKTKSYIEKLGIYELTNLKQIYPHAFHVDPNALEVFFMNGIGFRGDWYYGCAIDEGPLVFNNHWKCDLECSSYCAFGPPLHWAWTVYIDTTRRFFYITKQPIPRDYVQHPKKQSPYNRRERKCLKCE